MYRERKTTVEEMLTNLLNQYPIELYRIANEYYLRFETMHYTREYTGKSLLEAVSKAYQAKGT